MLPPKVWERMKISGEKVGQRRSEDDSEVELLAEIWSLSTSWPEASLRNQII